MDRYYRGPRFETPLEGVNGGKQVQNPYDIDSAILQDMIERGLAPFVCYQRLDLSAAGQQEFNIPGKAIVIYGTDGSTNHTVNTTAYVELFLENQNVVAGTGFPMKHARGFRGPFSKFTLMWPAQNNVFMDLVVHRFDGIQWVDGESCT